MQSSLGLHCVGVCVCAQALVWTLKKCSLNTLFMSGTIQCPRATTVIKDCIGLCPCSQADYSGFQFSKRQYSYLSSKLSPTLVFHVSLRLILPPGEMAQHYAVQKEKGERRRERGGGIGKR